MNIETPSHFAPKDIYQFSGKGEVYSYTIVERDNAPEGYKDLAPYPVAIVKLEEGPRVTAQLTDVEKWVERKIDGRTRLIREFDVEIGMPVEMVTRLLMVEGDPDRGLLVYGYKFRPLLENSAQSE
ncbi:MAG: Zn-ribbon domain-containing OB-fold protein [Patescibacteria group bacterium]